MARIFNCSPTSIRKLRDKFNATGSVLDVQRRARNRITTRRQDRQILLGHLRNRRLNARTSARDTIGRNRRPVSDQTIRNRLKEFGLRSRRPFVGIRLTDRHRALRLRWARRHLRLTRADWANVVFTDESKFNVQGNDARDRVYRRRGERFARCCIKERDWFGGGSIMVWGGISLHSKTAIVIFNGRVNANRYQEEVLRPVLIPFVNAHRGMMLAQDNAPCHTARATRQLLAQNNVRVMDWPPCSPDLNPIEHVWDEVGRRVRARRVQQSVADLQADIRATWIGIPQQFLRNYITSMRQRCLAVIAAGGGHTGY